ncbi:hypothetical protein VTO42DRAFT_6798 [Malbranchea cinnamomea]
MMLSFAAPLDISSFGSHDIIRRWINFDLLSSPVGICVQDSGMLLCCRYILCNSKTKLLRGQKWFMGHSVKQRLSC